MCELGDSCSLHGPDMDTCEHRDIYYERSECGFCGGQDAYCQRCNAAMCGCRALLKHPGIDLGAPTGAPVAPSATEGLKGPQIFDPVERPAHYQWLPVEAIQITERFNFCMGNALKYILRADHKGRPVEDLKKAVWYLQREIANREAGDTPSG